MNKTPVCESMRGFLHSRGEGEGGEGGTDPRNPENPENPENPRNP